jgi:hypothetical protein
MSKDEEEFSRQEDEKLLNLGFATLKDITEPGYVRSVLYAMHRRFESESSPWTPRALY